MFVNLLTAVAAGIFFANILTVKRLADNQAQSMSVINQDEDSHGPLNMTEAQSLVTAAGKVQVLHFNGPISYASIKAIKHKFQDIEDYQIMIFDFTLVASIDISTALALGQLFTDTADNNSQAFLAGVNTQVSKAMQSAGVINNIPDNYQFDSLAAAIHDGCLISRVRVDNGIVD